MTPLALFLVACAAIFLGTVQTAFSALMRLSLRLMAERGGRGEQLGQDLDHPLYPFIPVRVLIAMAIVRRDPEAVLDVLLPIFTPLAGLLMPITIALIEVVGRRERETPPNG